MRARRAGELRGRGGPVITCRPSQSGANALFSYTRTGDPPLVPRHAVGFTGTQGRTGIDRPPTTAIFEELSAMARGVNKVILVGTLGADPETRYTAGGGAITKIRIATNESWKDKQTGQKQERTEWHRVVFFGKLAEIAGEYLKKGRQVYVEGALRTDKYTDKEGVERYSTDMIANEMQMLGGPGAANVASRDRSAAVVIPSAARLRSQGWRPRRRIASSGSRAAAVRAPSNQNVLSR